MDAITCYSGELVPSTSLEIKLVYDKAKPHALAMKLHLQPVSILHPLVSSLHTRSSLALVKL